jgi:hypothetical protein
VQNVTDGRLAQRRRTRIQLQDAGDKTVAQTEHVNANAGVEIPEATGVEASDQSLHFSLGPAAHISDATDFKISLERASDKDALTPDAWVEGAGLTVVRGRVTDAAGKPVAGAGVTIAGTHERGQVVTQMRTAVTDRRGFYSCDDVAWPYTVGAMGVEATPSSRGWRVHYTLSSQVREGSQTANLSLDPFPVGTASVSGTATDLNGSILKEFTVLLLKMDRADLSPETRYEFSIREVFVGSNGRFKIGNLPAGTYNVIVLPTTGIAVPAGGPFAAKGGGICRLHEGQETKLTEQDAPAPGIIRYGRVQFEDGTPAVLDSSQFKTLIAVTITAERSRITDTIATVDSNGYFATPMPDRTFEQLQSGDAWLSVCFGGTEVMRFPFSRLSLERDKAAAVAIPRPNVYYGRVLYENGKPAIPIATPWPDAKVLIELRTPSLNMYKVDKDGCFAVCLTDEMFEQLQSGQARLGVCHPAYDTPRFTPTVARYPADLLARQQDQVTGYTLRRSEMSGRMKDLGEYVESGDRVQQLAAALKKYADSHSGSYPGTLGQLDLPKNDLTRLTEAMEYVPPIPSTPAADPSDTVLAYDRTLLKNVKGTHALFRDGHIEFCQPRRLRVLGILEPGESTSR